MICLLTAVPISILEMVKAGADDKANKISEELIIGVLKEATAGAKAVYLSLPRSIEVRAIPSVDMALNRWKPKRIARKEASTLPQVNRQPDLRECLIVPTTP
ncbi:MAG: hypothetical protein RLZZ561_576 [Pseudomonadota bacterium]|jgi:hypothetical protein